MFIFLIRDQRDEHFFYYYFGVARKNALESFWITFGPLVHLECVNKRCNQILGDAKLSIFDHTIHNMESTLSLLWSGESRLIDSISKRRIQWLQPIARLQVKMNVDDACSW
jgi:hypothetical protein